MAQVLQGCDYSKVTGVALITAVKTVRNAKRSITAAKSKDKQYQDALVSGIFLRFLPQIDA